MLEYYGGTRIIVSLLGQNLHSAAKMDLAQVQVGYGCSGSPWAGACVPRVPRRLCGGALVAVNAVWAEHYARIGVAWGLGLGLSVCCRQQTPRFFSRPTARCPVHHQHPPSFLYSAAASWILACCTMAAPLSRRRPLEVVVVNSHLSPPVTRNSFVLSAALCARL